MMWHDFELSGFSTVYSGSWTTVNKVTSALELYRALQGARGAGHTTMGYDLGPKDWVGFIEDVDNFNQVDHMIDRQDLWATLEDEQVPDRFREQVQTKEGRLSLFGGPFTHITAEGELFVYNEGPEGIVTTFASSALASKRLAKKGDKGVWKEHVDRPHESGGVDQDTGKPYTKRVPTGEKAPVRVTEDQKPDSDRVKIAPRKASDDDAAKEVPAKEVELEDPD